MSASFSLLRTFRRLSLLVCLSSLFVSPLAGAADPRDGVAVEGGYGYHVDMARFTLTRDWQAPILTGERWAISPYWDLALGHWNPHNPAGGNHAVTDVGVTPVFRVTERERSAIAPYAELAVGLHYISDHRIYTGRDMSTHFQFGDHAGVGVSFGEKQAFDLGLRLQHLSNAGLKNPNPGINFYQVRAAYHF